MFCNKSSATVCFFNCYFKSDLKFRNGRAKVNLWFEEFFSVCVCWCEGLFNTKSSSYKEALCMQFQVGCFKN
jgi:hypothetical protein